MKHTGFAHISEDTNAVCSILENHNSEGVKRVLGSDLQHSKPSVPVNQQRALFTEILQPHTSDSGRKTYALLFRKSADPTIAAQAMATVPNFLGSSTLNKLQKTTLFQLSTRQKSHPKQCISRTTSKGECFPSFLNCQQMSCTDLFPSVNNEKSVQVKSTLGTRYRNFRKNFTKHTSQTVQCHLVST